MESIEQIGIEIVKFLENQDVLLEHDADGRLESLKSEVNLTDLLREKFKNRINILNKGHNRSFGDIDIKLGDSIYPINVKMVDPSRTGTFNGGGPKVFNHVLYGETTTHWKKLAKKVTSASLPQEISSDYYYLIYYKNSKKKPVFIGLSDIDDNSIVTNPSNPIQLKKNVKFKARTQKEKVNFVASLLEDVLRKRAEPYLILRGKR